MEDEAEGETQDVVLAPGTYMLLADPTYVDLPHKLFLIL